MFTAVPRKSNNPEWQWQRPLLSIYTSIYIYSALFKIKEKLCACINNFISVDLLFFWVFFSVDLLFFCVFIFWIGQFFKRVNYLFPHYILHVCIITSQDSCTGVNYWESGWCSGYSHRLAPMHPGFNSTCIVQMVFPIHACSRRFFPGSPVSSCLQIWDVFGSIKNTPHPGEMGSCCVVKKWMLQSKCW